MLLPKLIYGQAYYELPIADSIVPIDIISIDGNYVQIISHNGIYEVQGTSLAQLSSFDEIELTHNTHISSLENNSQFGYAYPVTQGGYLTIHSTDSIVYSYLNKVPESVAVKVYGTQIKCGSETYIIRQNTFRLIEDSTEKNSEDINDTRNCIIDIHNYNDSITYVLSENTLYQQKNNERKKLFQIDSLSSEELVGLYIDKNSYKWVLTNERIIIIPRKELIYSAFPYSMYNYSLYSVNDNLYATDSIDVYQYINEDWIKINEIDPPVQRRIRQEKAKILGEQYFSYNEIDDKVIISSKSGIQISRNETVEFYKPIAIGESNNLFIENGKFFYFAGSSIFHLDIKDHTEEGMITLMKSTIIDIINYEDQLIVLNSKSLIFLDKASVLRNRIAINRVIPISKTITSGSLSLYKKQLFIATKNCIISVHNNDVTPMILPSISINATGNKEGIPSFKNSNFLTDNINYTYFIRSDKGNKTLWSKQPQIYLEDDGITTYKVLAKMRDDVFIQDIYSDNFQITVGSESLVDRLIKILSAILATLLILWAIRKWIMRE